MNNIDGILIKENKKIFTSKQQKEICNLTDNQFICFNAGFKGNQSLPGKISDCFSNDSLYVVTSSIIYNKKEYLYNNNRADSNFLEEYSNSKLILDLYKHYGYEISNFIDGEFVFVIWDKLKRELFCSRSKTGRIPLYYLDRKESFIFSTNFKTFFCKYNYEISINDQYVKDFLSLKSVSHELDANLTIYNSIKQLPPGNSLLIKNGDIRLWQYWKPEKRNEIILKNDDEYEQMLVELLKKAVKKRINKYDKIGILLSGGFDSGAVAALCCKDLNIENKTITTFTSVPDKKYQNWLSKRAIADETLYVKEYKTINPEIDMNFLSCEGRNSYINIDEYIKIFEQPYKFIGNSFWLVESVKAAGDLNLDMLLTGQIGNSTISWGSFYPYLIYLAKQKQYKEFFKEMKYYSALKDIKMISVLKRHLTNRIPLRIKKRFFNLFGKNIFPSEFLPVNREFLNLHEQEKRFKSFNWDNDFISVSGSLSQRLRLLRPGAFSHLGALYSKLGLKYGVLITDPTDDVEILEFCLNLPENQFVRDGVERRLIKRAMKGYIPDKILNAKVRGRQAADWVQRIKPYWPVIKEELLSIGDFQLEKKYLDRTIIQKNLDMLEGFDFIRSDNIHMIILFRALVFSRFLRMIEKGTLFDD
ncbi:MAG TPA: asparagine synthase-related protein [Thermotogota bacterium]|nr:asparagine synthase-related protein [Thermotogota bacterium]